MARSALPALLLLLLAAVHAETRADDEGATTTTTALDMVCGSLGGEYVTPGLCHSALCSSDAASDPCGRAAATRDAPAVAALAARLAARNATVVQASIQQAVAGARGGNKTTALSTCLQLYAGVVPSLRWAAASAAAGRYRGAREVMQAAVYAAGGCGGVMEGDAAALPPENRQFSDMAMVAHAVLAYMASE